MKKRKFESNERALMLIKKLSARVDDLEKSNEELRKENTEIKQEIKGESEKTEPRKIPAFTILIIILTVCVNGWLLYSIFPYYTGYSGSRTDFYVALAFAAVIYVIVIIMKHRGKIKLKSSLQFMLYLVTLTTILLGAKGNINYQNSMNKIALDDIAKVEIETHASTSKINDTIQTIKKKDAICYEHYASQFLVSVTIGLPTFALLYVDADEEPANNGKKEKTKSKKIKKGK